MPYLKITNLEENHFGFQYKDGLNVDPKPFNPNPKMDWGEGGLYFTDEQHILEFLHHDGWLRVVEIPSDAKVVHIGDQSRADKILLKEKYDLHNVNTWKFLEKIGGRLEENIEKIAFWACKFYATDILKYLGNRNLLTKEIIESCIEMLLNYDNGVQGFFDYNQGIKAEFYSSSYLAFQAYQQKFPDQHRKDYEMQLIYLFGLYKKLTTTLTSETHTNWLKLVIGDYHPYVLPYFDRVDLQHLHENIKDDKLCLKEEILNQGLMLLFDEENASILSTLDYIFFKKDFVIKGYNDTFSLAYPIDIIYGLAAGEGYIAQMEFLEKNYITSWKDINLNIPKHLSEERYKSNILFNLHVQLNELPFTKGKIHEKGQIEIIERDNHYRSPLLKMLFKMIEKHQIAPFELIEENKWELEPPSNSINSSMYMLLLIKAIKHNDFAIASLLFKEKEYIPKAFFPLYILNNLIKYNQLTKEWLERLEIKRWPEFFKHYYIDISQFKIHINSLFEIATERNDTELMEYLLEIS